MEENQRNIHEFKIEYKTNPFKCSIFWDRNLIVFDPVYLD